MYLNYITHRHWIGTLTWVKDRNKLIMTWSFSITQKACEQKTDRNKAEDASRASHDDELFLSSIVYIFVCVHSTDHAHFLPCLPSAIPSGMPWVLCPSHSCICFFFLLTYRDEPGPSVWSGIRGIQWSLIGSAVASTLETLILTPPKTLFIKNTVLGLTFKHF